MNKAFDNGELLELFLGFYPGLTKSAAKKFLSICSYEIYQSKQVIFEKDRLNRKLFILLKGSARSYDIVDGIEKNCHLRSEGFIMGDGRAFGKDNKCILYSEAITDCHILLFDLDELEKLAFEDEEIMRFYVGIMKEIIAVFSRRIHSFVTRDAQGRYEELMEWSPSYLNSTFDKHLASFLGMTPLTFSRVKRKTIK